MIGLNDALQAWEKLAPSFKANDEESASVEHSFLTPNIIGIFLAESYRIASIHHVPSHIHSPSSLHLTAVESSFQETPAECFQKLTEGKPTVIWNLGGKAWPPEYQATFDNQVVNMRWKSVCQYTRAPLLECLFDMCSSIKSWLDLGEANIAILSCPRGQSNIGILMACLLKFTNRFDKASLAYDFYCSKRYSYCSIVVKGIVVKCTSIPLDPSIHSCFHTYQTVLYTSISFIFPYPYQTDR
jgi:hypothetical protein